MLGIKNSELTREISYLGVYNIPSFNVTTEACVSIFIFVNSLFLEFLYSRAGASSIASRILLSSDLSPVGDDFSFMFG